MSMAKVNVTDSKKIMSKEKSLSFIKDFADQDDSFVRHISLYHNNQPNAMMLYHRAIKNQLINEGYYVPWVNKEFDKTLREYSKIKI